MDPQDRPGVKITMPQPNQDNEVKDGRLVRGFKFPHLLDFSKLLPTQEDTAELDNIAVTVNRAVNDLKFYYFARRYYRHVRPDYRYLVEHYICRAWNARRLLRAAGLSLDAETKQKIRRWNEDDYKK